MNIWKKTKSVEGDSLVCVSLKKYGFPKITNLVSAHVIHNLPFRFPSNLTSKSFQFYSDLTSVPHRFLAGVTSVCFRLHFHLTSISFAIFNSREGCIPCLQIQMDDPRTAPETLQTNWVATENSHSSEKKTCLSKEQTSRFGSVSRAVSRVDKEHYCFRWFWCQHWIWKRLRWGALIWKSSNSCEQILSTPPHSTHPTTPTLRRVSGIIPNLKKNFRT